MTLMSFNELLDEIAHPVFQTIREIREVLQGVPPIFVNKAVRGILVDSGLPEQDQQVIRSEVFKWKLEQARKILG
jgi:hypothetical protein